MSIFDYNNSSQDNSTVKRNFSLSANPNTYVDRDSETTKILNRIENSAATVVGISGVRGSGKSSLALKVLSETKKKDYLTLLIHSPVGYEPREFLITVFRRVCEEVIFELERTLHKNTSIRQLGTREYLSQLRPILSLTIATAVVLYSVLAAYRYIQTNNDISKAQTEIETIQAKIDEINSDLNDLENKNSVPIQEANRLIVEYNLVNIQSISSTVPSIIPASAITTSAIVTSSITTSSITTTAALLFTLLFNKRAEYSGSLEYAQESKDIASFYQSNILSTLPALGITILTLSFFILLAPIAFDYVPVLRTIPLFFLRGMAYEYGLWRRSQRLLELLIYQTSFDTSSSAELTLGQLKSGLSRKKTFETRPLSLPGLTTEFGVYLGEISRGYKEKIVICLDELDKISTPQELDDLLKGIKGVLGSPQTHFILTVSEDALARFSSRRREERGIIESSFDEIVYLHRIDMEITNRIADIMLGSNSVSTDEIYRLNLFQCWLFGGGIPREIKRNIVFIEERGVNLSTSTSSDTWRALYESFIERQTHWAGRISNDSYQSYQYLTMLESIKDKGVPELSTAEIALQWCKDQISIWGQAYPLIIANQSSSKQLQERSDPKQEEIIFSRAALEMAIFTTGILFAFLIKSEEMLWKIQLLSRIFEFTSINVLFAGDLVEEYLKEQALL